MTTRTPGYAWVVVALLWVVALLNYLDRQVIFSLFPLLRRELGLSPLQLGLLGTAFLWVYAFASPVSGFLADRYGRKRVIVVSLLVWSIVTWLTGQARTFPELLWARGLMGLSEACYLPAALALIAAHHGEQTRSRATGLHFSGIYAGIVIGGVGGGWMGEQYGWRSPFLLLGVVGIAYSFVLLPLLREPAGAASANGPRIGFRDAAVELLRAPGFLVVLVVFGIKGVADWLAYTWMPLYLYERFGMDLTRAGLTATLSVQAGSVAGILFGGWLADRWAATAAGGRVWTQAVGLAAAAPFLFLVGVTGSAAFLVTGLVVFGVGRGLFDCNAMPVLCQITRPELRATGYGLMNFMGTFAGGLVAALAGGLKDTLGLGVMLQVAGVLLLVAAGLLWRLGQTMGLRRVPVMAASGSKA